MYFPSLDWKAQAHRAAHAAKAEFEESLRTSAALLASRVLAAGTSSGLACHVRQAGG